MAKAPASTLDNVIALAKKRGFVFQAGEIYGGSRSAWDYGPLGVELKENIKRQWWRTFVQSRGDMVGLDSSIILPKRVWEASGHVATFVDPLVECKSCHNRFREDHLLEAFEAKKGRAPETGLAEIACPNCGTRGEFTDPQQFSGLVKTYLGPVDSEAGLHYLRPETAQGIFVNFLNVVTATRQKPPFGIGQVGKAFRNEITPGNFIFRTREFEQMEMQFFVKPGTDEDWFEQWREIRMKWHVDLGLRAERLRWHAHGPGELAHYAKAAYDIEYEFPFGWQEIEGVHNRTDFDLSRHQEYSGKKLEYFDPATSERYIPYVVETSAGADRVTLTVMADAYREEEVEGETRVVMGFNPAVSPIKAAVLPLTRKDGLPEVADRLYHDIRRRWSAFYDDSGAIGRRYRRQDEVGTPWCITIDHDTLSEETVTIRERDAMTQVRIATSQVQAWIADRLEEAGR